MSTAVAVDPRTGEILSLADLNHRMVQALNELDASTAELDRLLRELGEVTFLYDVQWNATVNTSQAKSEDRRKAEAFAHCDATQRPNGESLARAKNRLEVQVRALRDGQHNIRALLSGYQSLSANARAEITGLGARP